MASYRYKALTADGALTSGVVDAASRADAIAAVHGLGHFPIDAVDAAASAWRKLLPQTLLPERPVASAALAAVMQALATLLRAGLPLDRALKFVSELGENRRIRPRLVAVLEAVRGGASLADAFEAAKGFPPSTLAMVRAGETGGNLEATLQRLADYLARASAIRETVISALVYPALLLCTAGVSVIVVLIFVLPQFASLFAQSGKALPFSTQLVISASTFLTAYWWAIVLGLLVAILAYQRAMRSVAYRRRRDALLLRIPVLGPLLEKIQVERFSRNLGTLLVNGVALPRALTITADTLTSIPVADAVRETALRLREGEQLSTRLGRSGALPALALDLVRLGEESGSLDEMLLRQADLYEREVKHAVDRMLTLLVPLLTMVMGAIVAGLISSIMLALLSINDLAM